MHCYLYVYFFYTLQHKAWQLTWEQGPLSEKKQEDLEEEVGKGEETLPEAEGGGEVSGIA